MKYYRTADRLMSILINCSPKEASHCEKASLVGEMMKEVTKELTKAQFKISYYDLYILSVIKYSTLRTLIMGDPFLAPKLCLRGYH